MTAVPMRLNCPECGELHLDEGLFATKLHHTHVCQHCGAVWRPAIVHTVGVRFLPGFHDDRRARDRTPCGSGDCNLAPGHPGPHQGACGCINGCKASTCPNH